MNYSGTITLSDSSRHNSDSGVSGYFYSISPTDSNSITSIIFDSTTVDGDQTFLQQQILGSGDLTLVLNEWGYFGGTQIDATTYSGGRWGNRWFDPSYLTFSIWYLDYDSSQYSLVGYQRRDAAELSVGNFYAPMQVPNPPGHYQIRWLYLKDNNSYGTEIVNPFTSVSRGIDAMRDYPYPSGWLPYPYGGTPQDLGALVMTIPVYEYRNLGESALFTLQFNGPVPAPLTYHWRFNGNTMISDGTKIIGTDTDTLIINNLLATDGGIYTCVVSDVIVSTYAFLVMDPP
jgi:hypothetical protein